MTGGDARIAILGKFIGFGGEIKFREGNVSGNTQKADQIAVVSPLGTTGLNARVKETANRAFGLAQVKRPYDGWILGADRLVNMADWVKLLTILTLIILALAVAFSSAAEFLVFTAAVAPLAVLTERRRFLLGIAIWNLTVPTVIAVAFGVCVAAWQARSSSPCRSPGCSRGACWRHARQGRWCSPSPSASSAARARYEPPPAGVLPLTERFLHAHQRERVWRAAEIAPDVVIVNVRIESANLDRSHSAGPWYQYR